MRIGDLAVLKASTWSARAGEPVRVTGLVPMPQGRAWLAVQPVNGGTVCVVPPEHIERPEPAPGPAAAQLQLGEMMDTFTKPPDLPDSPDPSYSTPNTGALQILHVPPTAIEPHPANPRKSFDAAKLAELAADISIRGILQPLVVRSLPLPDSPDPSDTPSRYQLVAGERRWRAAQITLPALADDTGAVLRPEWPGCASVPVIVRDDLTETDALAAMMSENLQRADLNPIELASGFRALATAGLRQTQIAARLGISQPAVASALALLRLPEAVQQFIASGQLSASHGRVLVRWSDLSPAYTLFVARYCVSQSVTVAQIEGDAVPWSWDAERAKLLVTLRDGSPVDWQTICRDGCPHGAYRGHNDWTGYCFRPECYAELATAAAAAKAEAARTLAERFSQAVARQPQASPAASAAGPVPQTEAAPGEPPPAAEDPLDHLERIDASLALVVGKWVSGYSEISLPPGCRLDECPHLVQGRYNGEPARACTDPACYKRLTKDAEQAAAAARKAAADALEAKARLAIDADLAGEAARCRLLAPLALHALQSQAADPAAGLKAVKLPWNDALFTAPSYDPIATPAELLQLLSELSEATLLRLAATAILAAERACAASPNSYTHTNTRTLRWWGGIAHDTDDAEMRKSYARSDAPRRAARAAARRSAGLAALPEPELSYACTGCSAALARA